jgi:hypothetical protein
MILISAPLPDSTGMALYHKAAKYQFDEVPHTKKGKASGPA